MPLIPVIPAIEIDGLPTTPQVPVTGRVERQRLVLDKGFEVNFDKISFRDGVYRCTGEVIAKYEVTVIRSSEMTIDMVGKIARAVGKTKIDDPEAEIECEQLEIDWGKKTGSATDLTLFAGGVRVWADRALIEPERWKLYNVRGTASRLKKPVYEATAREVELTPGKGGVARKLSLSFGALRLPTFPSAQFNLDRRVTGLQIPNITNRKGAGVGIGWSSSILVNDRTALFGSFGAFPRNSTNYGLNLASSAYKSTSMDGILFPRSDLGEYADSGYFDNIGMLSHRDEISSLRARRATWAIGSNWNIATNGRLENATSMSKMIEGAFDQGGERFGVGYLITGRVQRVRADSQSEWVDRASLTTTFGLPPIRITDDLTVISRADLLGQSSRNGNYGFGRFETGIVYEPVSGVSLGVGTAFARSSGRPDFTFDALPYERVSMARFDYRRGFLTLRYLLKYDHDQRRVYDKEYELAVVADGFEPFISARTFPSDYRFGLRFRLDDFVSKLLERDVKRKSPVHR